MNEPSNPVPARVPSGPGIDRAAFESLCREHDLVPVARRLMSDQLSPVLAYRRLVAPDERTAPSFLLESVEGGTNVGRHSFLGASPSLEVLARGHLVEVIDHEHGTSVRQDAPDPLAVPRELLAGSRPVPASRTAALLDLDPGTFTGGWAGWAGYDTVRWLEPEQLPFAAAPDDDRGLPDLHLGLYRTAVVFDHARKVLVVVHHVRPSEHASIDAAWAAAHARIDETVARLEAPGPHLPAGRVDLDVAGTSPRTLSSNMPAGAYERAVDRARAYIAAGDVFQVVLAQRFARETTADPFEVYRALRVVNPSPYMIYLQGRGAILVASSPEILCRVSEGTVVNRPLAGTRRRGDTPERDVALATDLLADEKERAEHVMLVDLGRNDLGRVCEAGSIRLERIMEIERYSHVMHLSSTVTGRLRGGLDGWDALRATLPVGTVSGAPKIRAMQIIDELEPTRRGPYAGAVGVCGFDGDLDMAIALRTMVVPVGRRTDGRWEFHLQAGAGIVADSVPASEREETVNKAAALARAIDLAETAFVRD